ncbi:MAG: DUF4920 domain-containing protein [Brumimicrobium sp.]|nr:DUF4920 domain-containing protein [Brumimicrobium sp.]
MNKQFYFIGLLALSMLISCTNNAQEGETEGEQLEQGDTTTVTVVETEFGPKKVDITKAVSTEEMLKQFEGKTEMDATIKANITEVCSKMGCWVRIDQGDGETIMVIFKDHFTIPTETAAGTVAYLTGKAVQDTISVDERRHYLEDANASKEEIMAITEPEYTVSFIAEGIKLEEKK